MSIDSLARIRGRIGGLALASQRDPRKYTARARATFLDRFNHEVDPDRVLPPSERARRAEAAKKLHFTRLALKSAKARSRRMKNGRSVGGAAETITGEETSDAEPNDTR